MKTFSTIRLISTQYGLRKTWRENPSAFQQAIKLQKTSDGLFDYLPPLS